MKLQLPTAVHDVPNLTCPGCKIVLGHSQGFDHDTPPTEGDRSICVHCGEWLVFDADHDGEMFLRQSTPEENEETRRQHPAEYAMFVDMTRLARTKGTRTAN